MNAAWLDPSELRVGLGCMRLSTLPERDEQGAIATIVAAAEAGVTVFDTAHAYGLGPQDSGHNERLLSRALHQCGADSRGRIVTKGGMRRAGDQWVADGRASTILADCEASLVALDGLDIDVFLVHAPDPRTPWSTTMRALARLLDEGLVRHVGVANVNRGQLDEALAATDISVVQVALSPYDVRAVRGGLVEFCEQHRITLLAHSPLGGPRRAGGLKRRQAVAQVAAARAATPAEVALAWLLDLSSVVVPIPGARRPESARSAARAARLHLDGVERDALDAALGRVRQPVVRRRPSLLNEEVVLLMGIPGAGKSRLAEGYAEQGLVRLNRDERGGSLRQLASALERELAAGTRRVVLDNTYLTRATRSYAIDAAARHRVPIRCTWIDTPLAQAQVNLVERLIDRFGSLPSPEELRRAARREPGLMMPTSQMRALRELERPSTEEGFAEVTVLPFVRAARTDAGAGVFVAAAALARPGWEAAISAGTPAAPHLVFDWIPEGAGGSLDAAATRLSTVATGPVEAAVCPHPAGPPSCWCRPPLPGLVLAFSRAHAVDPSRSLLVGTAPAHRTLATTLGATYVLL